MGAKWPCKATRGRADVCGLIRRASSPRPLVSIVFHKCLLRPFVGHLLDKQYAWRSFDARSEPANLITSRRNYDKPTCQGGGIIVGTATLLFTDQPNYHEKCAALLVLTPYEGIWHYSIGPAAFAHISSQSQRYDAWNEHERLLRQHGHRHDAGGIGFRAAASRDFMAV